MSATIRAIPAALVAFAFLGSGVMQRAATASPSMAQAAASPELHSQMTSHGLRMTLTVARSQYPQNALIQVKLTVKNISRHTVYVRSGLQAPIVFVLGSSGNEGYDPYAPLGDKTLLYQKGPGPRASPLHAGRMETFYPYLVLRGNRIEFAASLGKVRGSSMITLQGHAVNVRLTQEATPQISIATSPGLQATVTPPWPVSGSLFYYSQTSCESGSGMDLSSSGWTAALGTSVTPNFYQGSSETPACSGKRQWHALAGWLNHPVAAIDYVDGTFAAPRAHRPASAAIVRRVATVYGEAKPHIIRVQRTETDSTPHEPMYFVMLSGRFHRGHRQARYLYFSALAQRWQVWGIQGYDARHRLVWIDARLPT